MSLPLSKNKLKSISKWLIISVIIIISLFYFLFPSNKYSLKKRLSIAKKHLTSWQITDAEKILEPVADENKANLLFVNTYLEVLLKEGKIIIAKNYIEGIKENKIIKNSLFLLNKSQIYHFFGLPDSSAIIAKLAIAESRKTNNIFVEAKANNILGLIQFYLANYDSALVYQNKALSLSERSNIKNIQADALRQIGVINWYKGKLDSANELYKKALNIYKEVNDKIGEAITLNDIGLIYFDKKEWFKEYPYHLKAFKIQKEINDRIGLADTYYFLSNVPQFSKEIFHYKYGLLVKAYNLSSKIGYKWGKIISGSNLKSFIRKNISKYTSSSKKNNIIENNTGEGKIIRAISKLMKVEKENNIEKMISLSKKIFMLSNSYNYEVYKFWSLYRLSRALYKAGKIREAEKFLLHAKKLTYTKNGRKYYPISIELLLAQILKKQNKLLKAINLLKVNAAKYDSIYSYNINRPQTIFNYEAAVVSVYKYRSSIYSYLLDDLYLINDQEKFFEYSERQRQLAFWGEYNQDDDDVSITELLLQFKKADALKNNNIKTFSVITELEKIIAKNNNYDKQLNFIPLHISNNKNYSIISLQKRLTTKDVFIEYTFGEGNLYAFIIRKNRKILIKLNSNRKEIEGLTNFFRKSILRGKNNPKDNLWEGPAKNLYKKLIKPIVKKGLLNKGDNLIISPIKSLYHLPFNTLLSDENNFLITDYNISYVASSKTINKYKNLNIKSILGVAPGNSGLVFSIKEIKEIPQSLFEKKELLIGKNATKNNFLKMAPGFDVIHIAGHIKINTKNPLHSSIVFTDKKLEIHEILKTKIKPLLLILSECESGKAVGMVENSPTEIDLINFSRAFREAGVKNVIATKWLLDDKSAYLIIKYFYEIYKKEKEDPSFDEILSSAQRKYLRDAKNKNFKTHPFYWAAFYLSK